MPRSGYESEATSEWGDLKDSYTRRTVKKKPVGIAHREQAETNQDAPSAEISDRPKTE
eukprot:CAMPEP_0202954632 /NCGR_PEP_ID=MMETSP1395-20130829/50985_1 /ASSEMBLY_ACC=CAM_ASM_000871 /TAXON_ID=5961 /ORGANISM="Blepharisma japonicum, Strain Stock R1072" /LENGTH=57 /DNA_ID=CAMNT_0049670311 /DNA_START=12 /DNA_END=185 /DNA_ORIENTATION=+